MGDHEFPVHLGVIEGGEGMVYFITDGDFQRFADSLPGLCKLNRGIATKAFHSLTRQITGNKLVRITSFGDRVVDAFTLLLAIDSDADLNRRLYRFGKSAHEFVAEYCRQLVVAMAQK